MVTCPICGTRNQPGQAICQACGSALAAPGRTLVIGTQPVARAPSPQPEPPVVPETRRSKLQQTMVGVAPPAQGAAPQPDDAARRIKQTMIGVAPPAPGAAVPAAPPAPAAPAAAAPAGAQSDLGSTLASVTPEHVGPPPTPRTEVSAPAAPGAPRALPSRHKTQMGIAHPGIAPLAPGVAKGPGAPPGASWGPAPPQYVSTPPAITPRSADRGPTTPKTPSQAPTLVSADADPRDAHRMRNLRAAALAIVGVAALLAALILVLALVLRARGPVAATVALDGRGRETLALECTRCEDGTVVVAGGAEATFANRKAQVSLTRELTVGANEVTITLRHPDGRAEDIDLIVPVSYRLRTDLQGLSATPPVVRVEVSALPETAVVVDGKSVTLDGAGKGSVSIDVSQDLSRPSATVTSLERRIPFTITPRHAPPERGEVMARIGVVPLVIDAPGPSIVIEGPTFWLAGRTTKTGTVSVSGRPITVDPAGRFAQLMNVSAIGETTIHIRADAPSHAPRLVPLRIRRVASLIQEARRLSSTATRSYAAIADNPGAKQDWLVLLEGTVTDARTDNHTTVLVLDVKAGCTNAPCLARVVHGAKVGGAKGSTVTAVGRVTGVIDWSGAKIPDVRADFVLEGAAP